MSDLPSERTQDRDPLTGRTVIRWTSSPAKDQHLYITSPSVTLDDRWLVFLSERDGHPNLYRIDRATGRIRRLTDNRRGLRLTYCYPFGGPAGLAKPTPFLDARRNLAYVVIDDTVWRCGLDSGEATRLAPLPGPGIAAYTHLDPSGRWFCVPLATPEAPFLEPAATQREQLELVWRWVRERKMKTDLWLIDTETGASRLWTTLPFWVSHLSFDPDGSGRAICNAEGLWHHQHFLPRIWCIEADGRHRPLYAQPATEEVGHENYDADGKSIVYHGLRGGTPGLSTHTWDEQVVLLREGKVRDSEGFIARRRWDGSLVEEVPVGHRRVHHATPITGGGYLADAHDGVIYRISRAGGGLNFEPLCRHDSGLWEDQDNHVHPVDTGTGGVVFTSRRAGSPDVYEVGL